MPEMERRLVIIKATFDFLLALMTEGNTTGGIVITTKGLPKDAKFIRDYFDHQSGQMCLVFSHPSFDEVSPGSMIPVRNIEFLTTRHDAGVAA
jgi:hypothetical protein